MTEISAVFEPETGQEDQEGSCSIKKYKYTCVDRFLRYVKYDTQSDEESTSFPSTEKQKKLSADLAKELKKMGLKDAAMDKWGYVMATLPANTAKKVPTIAFIAHVDTSPAVSGKGVKPIVHRKYKGGDIRLPKGGKVIQVSENPDLKKMKGFDIITSDGATLLGADNKAGIAGIMDAANYLITHPEIKHGPIKICFTPDEEVGRGTEKIDLKKLGAKYAYTVDGSSRGEVESETFSADMVVLKFIGKNIHPGYAKNKMINSIKIAAAFMESLPKKKLSPETTEKRQGYVHCTTINGLEEATTLKIIIRDFETPKLKEYEELLKKLAKKAVAKFPGSKYEFKVINQYRNMREVLRQASAGDETRGPGDEESRDQADTAPYSRRNRWFETVVHGIAYSEHLRGRAQLPLTARMDRGAGHGNGGSGDRRDCEDLGERS